MQHTHESSAKPNALRAPLLGRARRCASSHAQLGSMSWALQKHRALQKPMPCSQPRQRSKNWNKSHYHRNTRPTRTQMGPHTHTAPKSGSGITAPLHTRRTRTLQ